MPANTAGAAAGGHEGDRSGALCRPTATASPSITAVANGRGSMPKFLAQSRQSGSTILLAGEQDHLKAQVLPDRPTRFRLRNARDLLLLAVAAH